MLEFWRWLTGRRRGFTLLPKMLLRMVILGKRPMLGGKVSPRRMGVLARKMPVFVVEERDIGLRIAQPRKPNIVVPDSRIVEQGSTGEKSAKFGELKPDAWRRLNLSPYLLNTAVEGVHFPLCRKPRSKRVRNYVKEEDKEAVDAKWEEWKEKGVLEKGEVALVMAIGAVPKKNGKVRVTHNCIPINKCVPDMPFSLDGIAEVAKLLELGDWMGKIDLKDGYEHIKIHRDWRKYYGASWKGEILRYAKLGYGFKLSPVFFQNLMLAVVEEANRRMGGLFYFVYLDDFLIRARSLEKCIEAVVLL